MKKIKILNGPNLNLLGIRESEIYGNITLNEINNKLKTIAKSHNVGIEFHQTNSESVYINHIHDSYQESIDFMILNPAAFTHTSIAIRDALLATRIKFIEVHLSNTMSRESFRHKSFVSDIACGTISGFGGQGYEIALELAIKSCNKLN